MKLINNLKALLSQTTVAPWISEVQSNAFHSVYGNTFGSMADATLIAHNMKNEIDSQFIAEARNAMPLLIRAAECLRDILQNDKGNISTQNFDKAQKVIEELGDDDSTINVVPVFDENKDGYHFGLEVYLSGDVLRHVGWFKNEVFRDLAITNLRSNPDFVIPVHWNDIGTHKTAVFNDPLHGSAWFIVNGNLLGAPISATSTQFCPAEAFSPDDLPKYHRDFIENFLSDIEVQKNYEYNTFYYVFTDELTISVNENFVQYLQTTEYFEDIEEEQT